MMRADYLSEFCPKCRHRTDHVRLTYINHTTLTCMICQHDHVVEEAEIPVKKTYTIVSIFEKDRNTSGKKRLVVVEVLRKTEPDKLGETEITEEIVMVQYSAYGATHYSASLCRHPDGGPVNFKEARVISKEIKKFIE